MPARRISLVLGIALVTGTIVFAFILGLGIGDCLRGRGLCRVGPELASGDPAGRAVFVLLFLAVVPTAAIAGLLRTLDGFARLIIACTANITILALTAMIMLAAGVWSPRGGLLAVAAITAACLVAQLPPVRRSVRAQAASWREAARNRAARRGRSGARIQPAQTAAARPESSVPVVPVLPAAKAFPVAPARKYLVSGDNEPPVAAAAPDAPTQDLPVIGDP